MVHRDGLSRLHEIMTIMGYERAFHSTDVSQYRHKDAAWGAVDFLHAYRSISVAMLSRALSLSDKGSRTMRVLQPEDVIGLKVQAMANDPRRKDKEMADIETLMGRLAGEPAPAVSSSPHSRMLL